MVDIWKKEFANLCKAPGYKQYRHYDYFILYFVDNEEIVYSPIGTPAEFHYEDGKLIKIYYYDHPSRYQIVHRVDGPAVIEFSSSGNKIGEYYFQNGKMFRDNDKPNRVTFYDKFPVVTHKEEYFANERYHRIKGPALSEYYPNGILKKQEYYYKGHLHWKPSRVERRVISCDHNLDGMYDLIKIKYFNNGRIEHTSFMRGTSKPPTYEDIYYYPSGKLRKETYLLGIDLYYETKYDENGDYKAMKYYK